MSESSLDLLVQNYLRSQGQILVLRCDAGGRIVEANDYCVALLAGSLKGH